MSDLKRGGYSHGVNEINVTPLADVCTVLILVFLVTMPDVLWKGIQVNATKAAASAQEVVHRADNDDLITIVVAPGGLALNGQAIALADLAPALSERLSSRTDKTVVVVPSDAVPLGQVVNVMDVAKASGATRLALLDRREG